MGTVLVPRVSRKVGGRWVVGSRVAYILRAAFISIRRDFDPPPSKPNLRSISRANTLPNETSGRARATLLYFSPFSSYFRRDLPPSRSIRATPSLRHIGVRAARFWACSLNWLEFPAGRDPITVMYVCVSLPTVGMTNLTHTSAYARRPSSTSYAGLRVSLITHRRRACRESRFAMSLQDSRVRSW